MKAFFLRTLPGFECLDDESRDAIKGIKFGEPVEIDIKTGINVRFRAKYHMLLKTIFENQERFDIYGKFKDWSRIKIGQCDEYSDGDVSWVVPRSPTFSKAPDDAEFERDWYQPTLTLGVSMMHGIDEHELREHVDSLLGRFG